jgi:pumilio RNA-binding family
VHPPPPGLLTNTSPDLSPISATSSLLTPTDSPARSSCLKLDIPYDYHPSLHPSVHSPQGLQLQTGTYRPQDIFSAQSSRFPIPQHSHPYQFQDVFPFYEPFSERPALSPTFPISNSIHAGDRRVLPDLPWYSDRMQPSTDWLRPDDCVRDHSSGLVAEEPSIPPQKTVPSSPQGPQGVGSEVCTF